MFQIEIILIPGYNKGFIFNALAGDPENARGCSSNTF